MMTLMIDRLNPAPEAIRAAADAIRRGELVVLPMESAYILAVDARNRAAVSRVFDATDREEADPLSLLVSGFDDALKAAEFVPDRARELTLKYWPGHLALIVDKGVGIPDVVTGGKETVFVMAPEHPVALALLQELRTPVAATNACVTGNEPPTTALEAVAEVGNYVSTVLDAGRTMIGEIPTVVDVSTVPPRVVQVGTIPTSDVEAFLGIVQVGAR